MLKTDNFRCRAYYVILYFLSWGLILLNDGIYWDDWTILNVPPDAILMQHVSNGYVLNAYLIKFIFSLTQNILVFRAYVFLMYLCIVLMLDDILSTIESIDDVDRFFVVLIFAVLPINFARITVTTTFIFNTSFFLFIIGFWILSKYMATKNNIFRACAIIMFLSSFFTPSVILFYAVAIFFILYKERADISGGTSFAKKCFAYSDFILAPLVFSILRAVYFSPRGLYEGYNVIKLSSVLKAPLKSLYDLKGFFYELTQLLGGTFKTDYVELVIATFILFAFMDFIYGFSRRLDCLLKKDIIWFLMGIILFILGVFPYVVVNKHPYFVDWVSRYHLLLGIGASFVIYYGVKVFVGALEISRKAAVFLISLVVVCSIHTNIFALLDYQRDTFKEQAITKEFSQSDIVRNNTNFCVKDNIEDLNARERTYRFYEYTGIMKLIFGDEKRFASRDCDEWRYDIIADFTPLPLYNMRSFVPVPPQYKITINCGEYNLKSTFNALKLLYFCYFDSTKYQDLLGEVVSIGYEKL